MHRRKRSAKRCTSWDTQRLCSGGGIITRIRVWITCGDRQLFVYVAEDSEQRYWFWWETMLPIAPAVEVSKAADMITRRIARM